jgi:putative transposase
MNLARSTYYEEPAGQQIEDAVIVEMIGEICAQFPRYHYRRVTAQLRRDGITINHKKVSLSRTK